MALKRVIEEREGSDIEEIENSSASENEDSENADQADNEDNSEWEDVDENLTSDDESNTENLDKNSAWADSISKILSSKTKANKALVLSKAKKLTDVKPKPKELGFEVVNDDGNIKKEIVEEKPLGEEKSTKHKIKKLKQIPGLRVKPDPLKKDYERALRIIATRGVVKVFTDVKKLQTDISKKIEEAGPLEVRKEKVMKNIDKNTFLDVLMGQKSQAVDEVLEKEVGHVAKKQKLNENETSEEKVWNVLKDNYMMDAKMKDWDKELEIEEAIETELN